jgi:signal transduction histidine kinase
MLIQQVRLVEQERQRISRDLHDELGAVFSVLSVTLAQLKLTETNNRILIQRGKELVDNGIQRVRRIAQELIPAELALFGLTEAVSQLCRETEMATGLRHLFLYNEKTAFALSKESELAIFRILQELISNSLKHARAHQLTIRMSQQESTVQIEYSDDGTGIAPNAGNHRTGHGINNIESRVILLKGKWEILQPLRGYACRFSIPKHSTE